MCNRSAKMSARGTMPATASRRHGVACGAVTSPRLRFHGDVHRSVCRRARRSCMPKLRRGRRGAPYRNNPIHQLSPALNHAGSGGKPQRYAGAMDSPMPSHPLSVWRVGTLAVLDLGEVCLNAQHLASLRHVFCEIDCTQ